ncbi:hypothetical protein BDY21DRAFT_374115 [Lineolata rhizophorae]|uniref:EDC4-like protein pdc1 beta-propeller domain-containing protein n=1 Tax=Lineolata rhizophorae TaxID=578093 RepID=A0A6A6NS12_9PEZI|nr:hypothetical protein BDY21DRAFT_374115 [Lineolata rhizophorae]
MANLEELFGSLQQASATSSSNRPQHYHHPSVSSPIYSPPPHGPEPHHASAIMSPTGYDSHSANQTPPAATTPHDNNMGRTANLLNLLRSKAPAQQQQPGGDQQDQAPAAGEARPSHAYGSGGGTGPTSASDLVASFMRKPQPSTSSPAVTSPVSAGRPSERPAGAGGSSENPQDFLLKLLNQGKPPQPPPQHASSSENAAPAGPKRTASGVGGEPQPQRQRKTSPMRIFGEPAPEGETTNFTPPPLERQTSGGASAAAQFTYRNPFQQLADATPKRHTPQPRDASASESDAKKASPANKSRKIVSRADSRSRGESPFASSADAPRETVSEALSAVASRVDQQVESALADAEKRSSGGQGDFDYEDDGARETVKQEAEDELEEAVHEAAEDIVDELEHDPEARETLEEIVPKDTVDELKDIAEEIAREDVAEGSAKQDRSNEVVVYQFPIKPFVSITVKNLPEKCRRFRPDSVLEIARLKKEFNQIDRALVAASKAFIVYAVVKTGGLKLIRQDSGFNKQIFPKNSERIFNVSICALPNANPEDERTPGSEYILATGVGGSVFWVRIPYMSAEGMMSFHFDSESFIFPPVTSLDDNTSGGQLKTRARKSSRHLNIFAIGRGKYINFIWADEAMKPTYIDQSTRICDSESYLSGVNVHIYTGKAGKDFAFSEDDSCIVSLDKAGKLKFWDVADVLDMDVSGGANLEISHPLISFPTYSSGEKAWPTSVFFLDKEKPTLRGLALRYLIVGQKQNHSLQLWDLALGKPVQEIHFPHEKESDAICSVCYHPKTGIIAVGHPTRNSIYFISLSAPRYNLSPMSQAQYIARLASKDPIPKPESTAILSGIREFSFESKGQLRSLEMLNTPAGGTVPEGTAPEDMPVFELYVMHSRGVTCLTIKGSDLGWEKGHGQRNKNVVDSKHSEEAGVISVGDIKLLTSAAASDTTTTSVNGEALAPSAKSTPRDIKKEVLASRAQTQTPEAHVRATTLQRVEKAQDAQRAAILNGAAEKDKDKAEKSDKKKKKQRLPGDSASQTSSGTPTQSQRAGAAAAPPPTSHPAAKATTSAGETGSEPPEWALKLIQSAAAPAPAPALLDTKPVEEAISSVFRGQIERLHTRLDNERRANIAQENARHEAVLRLVSATLTENVQKALSQIIEEKFTAIVSPSLRSSIDQYLRTNLHGIVVRSLQDIIPREVKAFLPSSLKSALLEPDSVRTLTEALNSRLSATVDAQLLSTLNSTYIPAVQELTANNASRTIETVERLMRDQQRQHELARRADAVKIDQLSSLVQSLSEMVHTMATSQDKFQREFNALKGDVLAARAGGGIPPSDGPGDAGILAGRARQQSGSMAPQMKPVEAPPQVASSPPPPPQMRQQPRPQAQPPPRNDTERIARMLQEGQWEAGTIAWLQSNQQVEIFDELFCQVTPDYLSSMNQLVRLSICAAVTTDFTHHVDKRLQWCDDVLAMLDPHDEEIQRVVAKVLDVISERLDDLFTSLYHEQPASHLARFTAGLLNKVRNMRAGLQEGEGE